MKNLTTNFETFVNEGIIPQGIKNWFKSPKEIDDIIKQMFSEMVDDFDFDKLSIKPGNYDRDKMVYDYFLKDGTKLTSSLNTILIDGQQVSGYVSDNLIKKIFNFLDNKWRKKPDFDSQKSRRKTVYDLRDKYQNYIPNHKKKYYPPPPPVKIF